MTRKLFAVFQILIALVLTTSAALLLYSPQNAFATTCGTGSSISFTDIGGGECRGYITVADGGSFIVPTNWTTTNTVEVIGGGGGGRTNGGAGGGGGGYSAITGLSLTPSASIVVQVGSGGPASSNGGDTYFNDLDGSGTTCDSSGVTGQSVCAKGGTAGGTSSGGAGGSSGSGVGTTVRSGGTGGTDGSGADDGGGGGGAAGPSDNGATGGNGNTGASCSGGGGGGADASGNTGSNGSGTGNGGSGGNGPGGTGGGVGDNGAGDDGTNGGGGAGGAADGATCNNGTNAFDGGIGGDGTEWDATHGAGGGGGGGGSSDNSDGGNGGAGGGYGGGGGGGGVNYFGGGTDGTGGAGADGLIVITYTPASSRSTLLKPPNNLGLVGYWSFNEGTGTVATDFSGNGNTGALTNGPTWVNGKRGNSPHAQTQKDHPIHLTEGSLLVVCIAYERNNHSRI